MVETQESLTPVESQIRALLTKETQLATVAAAYTSIESDHAFWFELMGELRGAFASDAVWLIEMSPLYGYNPASAAVDAKAKPQPVVKSDFANAQASSSGSAISDPPAPPEQRPGNLRNQPAPVAAAANAILIKGFWRENPQSQNVVSELLKRLRENTKTFNFTVKDAKGMDTVLSDEQILKISAVGAEGDLGFPFELTLPLARPVKVK